jgi:hypothetical protein
MAKTDTLPNPRHNPFSLIVTLLLAYTPALFLLAFLVFAKFIWQIPAGDFLRDPVNQFDLPFYTGVVSRLGWLFWGAAVTVNWFTAALIWKKDRRWSGFFLAAGLITAVLMFDDILGLSLRVYTPYLGIPKRTIFLAYGLMVLAFLAFYQDKLRHMDSILLLSAFFFFTFSTLLDFDWYLERRIGGFFFEEGTKLLGIVGWLAFFIRTAARQVNGLLVGAGPDTD